MLVFVVIVFVFLFYFLLSRKLKIVYPFEVSTKFIDVKEWVQDCKKGLLVFPLVVITMTLMFVRGDIWGFLEQLNESSLGSICFGFFYGSCGIVCWRLGLHWLCRTHWKAAIKMLKNRTVVRKEKERKKVSEKGKRCQDELSQ